MQLVSAIDKKCVDTRIFKSLSSVLGTNYFIDRVRRQWHFFDDAKTLIEYHRLLLNTPAAIMRLIISLKPRGVAKY